MRLQLKNTADTPILAGSLTGRRILAELLDQIEGAPAQPEPVYLDFSGIELATASFARECVLEFRTIVRHRWKNLYPVVANASDPVIEELCVILTTGNAILHCRLDETGKPHSPQLLGEVEPAQRATLDLVRELGEADARELMEASKDAVGQTAWNNRLSALSKLGLIMEMNRGGRSKRYQPLPLES